jgi:hypothetical protein
MHRGFQLGGVERGIGVARAFEFHIHDCPSSVGLTMDTTMGCSGKER